MRIEVSKDALLGKEMYSAQLTSGMPAHFIPLHSSVHVAMYHVFTRFGSIDARFRNPAGETVEVEDGTAHFLEHCAFYDQQGNDALKWFNSKGMLGNAWTSFDHTTYYFHSTGQDVERNLEFLLGFVTTPYLTDEVVKKEQGVISQEIAMYKDMPDWVLSENLRLALLKEHPLRRSLAGEKDTIMRITKEYLQSAYDTFYHPSNLNLVIFSPSADALRDAESHFKIAEDICARRGFAHRTAPKYLYVDEPAEANQKRIVSQHSVPEPLISIGFKGSMGMAGAADERLKIDMVNSLLIETLFSGSSEARYGLVKRGIIRSGAFQSSYESGRGFGVFDITGSIDDVDKFEEGVIGMLKEQANGGLSRDLFDVIKSGQKSSAAGEWELGNAPKYALQQTVIQKLASGHNPMHVLQTLASVTYEDVLEAGKRYLDTDNYAVSIVLPRKS
ncbi:MAG: insulinase family protein [Nanoarchaeota archaeon]|nr:insulinase family protein [Nanoarchaeota archaeon]